MLPIHPDSSIGSEVGPFMQVPDFSHNLVMNVDPVQSASRGVFMFQVFVAQRTSSSVPARGRLTVVS
jgi:hypothetical protein